MLKQQDAPEETEEIDETEASTAEAEGRQKYALVNQEWVEPSSK